jgi:hypothetical protein
MSKCPITAWNLLNRRQFRKYTGQPAQVGGGYCYVTSDQVPLTQYWLVWWLSLIEAIGGTGFTNPFEVYLLPNGQQVPRLAAGNNPDDQWFLNYSAGTHTAAGPGLYGMRVDRFYVGANGAFNAPSHAGDEVTMFAKPFLLGPGESLMGWVQQYIAAPVVNSKLEMRMVVSQMNSDEEIPLLFTS